MLILLNVYNCLIVSDQYQEYLNLLQIKISDELNKEKDLKIIKILHDIQNPVLSMNLVLNSND